MSSDIERRLQDAFAAQADAVDVQPDPGFAQTAGQRPAARPQTLTRSWRRWRTPLLSGAAIVVVLGGATAGGVLLATRPDPIVELPPAATGTPTEHGSPAPGKAFPYDLRTHCGIDEARIGKVYYEAETPLVVAPGNPPQGWDNPVQHGFMTLLGASRAVFRDGHGHEVSFRARPGATTFKHLCD